MLIFFKINHEHCLEWKDVTDVLTFITVVIMKEIAFFSFIKLRWCTIDHIVGSTHQIISVFDLKVYITD